MSFLDADQDYRATVEATGNLNDAYNAARAVGKVNWSGTDITRAVLARMESFRAAQTQLGDFLDKHKRADADDFFVATVAFYLRVVIEIEKLGLRVSSEEVIIRKTTRANKGRKVPKQMRADICIWRDKELIAVIECKTTLGRQRRSWPDKFSDQEERLHLARPRAKLFLLVLSKSGWKGFEKNPRSGKKERRHGTQLFVLRDKLRDKNYAVVDRIEPLFHEIFCLAQLT